MRIRGFTQDDAHIFCTREQVVDEVSRALDFVLSVLRAFGFDDFEANLSTRPPEKSVGDDEVWEHATDALRVALERADLPYEIDEGGGAFYGPKIDVKVRDAIGRKWQLSTIQADFNLPDRFDINYIGADNDKHRAVMIHRALFGSVERFFGVVLEHFAGAFPAWLAPIQVRVLPVRDDHDIYARRLVDRLDAEGFRADMVDATEPLGGRIRKAKMEKLPYILVVGDDDVEHSTVGVNPRGGEVERGIPVEDFVERLAGDVTSHV
jgi:threonyl-tRNA synthetase